ncbi:MAG: hypothetical protein LBU51_00560 [Bacteroidales bacterium]|jgi:hypothetical protein|nr:hypothetical protein [Bacteroidales bacterium]
MSYNNAKNKKLIIIFFILLSFNCLACKTADAIIEIPFSLEDNAIILEARVNGKEGRYIWDTGSPGSYVDINVNNLKRIRTSILTYNGKSEEIGIYRLKNITISGIRINAHSWVTNVSSTLNSIDGYDGLLGYTIFNGYWCELSFSKGKILLHKERPKYFTKFVSAELINRFYYYCIPATIDGKPTHFIIDTGEPRAMLFPKSLVVEKNSNVYSKVFSNGLVEEYYLVKTDSLRILDETYFDKYIMTNSFVSENTNDSQLDNVGVLGINFLKNYDLLLDFTDLYNSKAGEVFYEPHIPVQDREYGFYSYITHVPQFGILNFHFNDRGIVIDSILENSIAYEKFGIRPNMNITKINGRDIHDISKEELYDPKTFEMIIEYTVLENYFFERVIKPIR